MVVEDPDSRTLGLSSVLPKNSKAFEPTFSGPRDVDRSFTDRGSFVLFCIFIGSVIAIASNAFLFGPGELEKLPRVFTSEDKACGTDDFDKDTSVLVWWTRDEPLFPTEDGSILRVCSSFCPQEGDTLCLDADSVVRKTKGTAGAPDPDCASGVMEWQTKTVQRFGRCFTDVESCQAQTQYEREELDKITSMDITIRALLDMWHSRWLILAVGCVIPIIFSYGLVRWLAKPRASKETFRIALPQVTLTVMLATLPSVSLLILNQKLKGFFECFYVDKFLMPAVSYVALAILAMSIIMAIACFLLRKKLRVCSKLAIETARCLRKVNGSQTIIILSCMASCSVAVGWFGMGSYVICWALDLESRERINSNLRTFILILFSVGCLWLAAFVGAVSRLVLSGAVSDWFWLHKPKDTKNSIQLSLQRALVNHPGTAAKGSLLITLFEVWRSIWSNSLWPLRAVYKFIKLWKQIFVTIMLQRKVDEVVEIGDNEELKEAKRKSANIHVISRRAYNSVALHGRGLIDSGVLTRKILKDNAYRVRKCYDLMGEINLIISFLVLVMCLCLAVVAGSLFEQPSGLGKGSESPIGMIFCVLVTSFTAVQGAFAPFHQASTALIQCFCEDLDRNDGSPVNPYRAHKSLRELVANEHQDVFNTRENRKGRHVALKRKNDAQEEYGKQSKLKKARDFLFTKVPDLRNSAAKSGNEAEEEEAAGGRTTV
ncbi:choline transporter-like domain-containing protein [Chloropicon primus]|uniref:Choline transporter-like protein n=1 Tax=Chloropicon primus TaxID=1764295 RepID=A0A5B8MZB6_9CHLO|nr:choline transporter-like domain-containing protein [Chloropicon primus]|eukprot:QDZ24880.1 choline transporter-like domain-containing protein [Chloropicon primus]